MNIVNLKNKFILILFLELNDMFFHSLLSYVCFKSDVLFILIWKFFYTALNVELKSVSVLIYTTKRTISFAQLPPYCSVIVELLLLTASVKKSAIWIVLLFIPFTSNNGKGLEIQ